MLIHKIFNNNVVLILDEKGNEKIVTGCGIAYKKKCGDEVDSNMVEKVFVLSDPEASNKFQEMLKYIPSEFIELGEDVIKFAAKELKKDLNEYIYISLIDHLYTAVKRHKEGIDVRNAILWDIKRFYKTEYAIGLKVLDMIEKRFAVKLPEDEAGFIAIHIVNSAMSETNKDMNKVTELISEIINIVKYNFNIVLDEDSVIFYRFVTHLKFFAERIFEGGVHLDDHGDDLLNTIRQKYVNAYECAQKIGGFINGKYKYEISNDEIMYLTIHIERVVYKSAV
jgi:beta-glucoside operon transcriptional antiterminator